MGRGRAKAKQTKVARELKYRSPNTDFSSLARELRGGEEHEVPPAYADLVESIDEGDYDIPFSEEHHDLRKSG
jgi:DNA topoisomerase IB